MSELVVVAAIFEAVWLGILTVTTLALVREIAVLSVRFQLGQPNFDGAADGLEMGKDVPDSIRNLLPETEREAAVVVLSATCAPCRQIASRLEARLAGVPLIALISGPASLADPLAASVKQGARIVRDPDATKAAHELAIQSTPFAMHLVAGRVEGKAYLHEASDLTRLIAARDRLKVTRSPRKEGTHASHI